MADTITIIVNGFPETGPEQLSLARLIEHMNEGDGDLIVEHNGRFVYPRHYPTTVLAGGDRVELINPNFGG